MSHTYEVTYRLDHSEVFETESFVVEAECFMDAANEAYRIVELERSNTLLSVERRI